MSYRVICDRCGGKYWNRQLRLEWDGLRVCSGPGTNECWAIRQPQDKVRAIPDKQTPPWVKPRPADVFVTEYQRDDDGVVIFDASGIPQETE